MWSLIKRLFRIGKAEANAAIDKLENPIKMTQQGIRDLKVDMDKSMQSLAEVKAIAIRTGREVDTYKANSDDYEKKAMALLKQGQSGQMDMAEAERLATEALARREENIKLYQVAVQNKQKYDGMVTNMEGKIRQLKSQIAKWENELRTLEARDKVSKATTKLNKQLTNIDSSGTMSMLERMKNKVDEQEALAEAYGEMANETKTVDDEINKALNNPNITASAALDDLKKKMGIIKEEKIEIKEKSDVTIKIEVDDKKEGA
jgi:phage shock protein A